MKKYNEYSLRKSSSQTNIDTHSKNEDDIVLETRLGDIELYVYWDDPVHEPHFHFVNMKTGEKGALKLETAEYCPHEIYNATLNKEQLKEIYEWLNQRAFKNDTSIKFDFLCASWGICNEKYVGNRTPPDKVPEYYKL